MSEVAVPVAEPAIDEKEKVKPKDQKEPGFRVICWDDPVNLMDFVTHVFQKVFNWPKEKAEQHMLQVHKQGKSVLVRETFEKAEHFVHQLQHYSLHATLEPD